MQTLVQDNLKSIQHILQKHNVKRAFVFASVCTENFNDNSDIDIIVSFRNPYFIQTINQTKTPIYEFGSVKVAV